MPAKNKTVDALRHDVGELVGGIEHTDEGYIKTDAVVTRTGVLTYRNADGTLRRELRHPDDIFRLDSIKTMKMIPMTNDHPSVRLLDAENTSKFQIGFTGENIRPDGKFIRATLTVTDENGVRAIEAGKRELSLGYRVDLVEEDGEYNGERYDFRQTNVRYNHLALVDVARAGAEARIEMDHADAMEIKEPNKHTDSKLKPNKRRKGMPLINLDNGCSYEVDSQEVVAAFSQIKKENSELTSKLDSANTEIEKTKAELDTSKARVDELEKIDVKAEAIKLSKERSDTIDRAKKVLDEKEMIALDGADVSDIKKAVIMKRFPDSKLDDAKDVYIDTRFDTIIELVATDKGEDDNTAARQRATVVPVNGRNDSEEIDADEARKKLQKERADAWKPKA